MSASSIRAGQAYVELATKNGLLDKGIAAAQASLRRMAASVSTMSASMGKGLGAVGSGLGSMVGSLTSLPALLGGLAAGSGVAMIATTFANAAGSIDDMAQRTGMVAEDISGLAYAAKMSGSNIETVEKAIRKMQTSGVSSGRGAMADFRDMATYIASIEDPAKRAEEAVKIFGKSGADLLPMMANGAQGIDEMMASAQELGVVMSSTDAAAGAALGDSMDQLWMTLAGLTNQIGAALAPALTWLIDQGSAMIATVSNWIAENKNLIANFLVLENAGKLVMLGIEIAWRTGMQPLYNLWQDFQVWLISGIANAATAIVNTFASIPTTLMNSFSTVITWLTGAWDQTVNYIAKKLLYLYSLFDSSINYEQAARQMDTEASGRAGARQKSLDEANARRSADQDRANSERAAYAEQFKAMVADVGQERKKEFDSRLQALNGEIARVYEGMRTEADAIVAAQASERAASAANGAAGGIPALAAVGDAVTAKTSGTFSGFAAGFLGSGQSPIDRLEKETKKGNQILQQIADNTSQPYGIALE